MIDAKTTLEALRELGVDYPHDFRAILQTPFPQSKEMLEALQRRVNKEFRRLSLVYHPDQNGGDEAKTERFGLLARVNSEIQKLQVAPAAAPVSFGWVNPVSTMNVNQTPSVVQPIRVRVIRFR